MPNKISRRKFIANSAMGILSAGAVFSGLNLNELLANSKTGKFIRIGDDIIFELNSSANNALSAVGGSVLFDNDEKILIRASQTQFTALSLICKHKGCTVELSGDRFVCPCHGSEYDLKGHVTHPPSKKDLDSYEAVYDPDKNTVTVNLSQKKSES